MSLEPVATKDAPAAIGPYSQAIRANGWLFCSGQIPINPRTAKVEATTIQEQTKQVMENLSAVLEEAGLSFLDVVKTTIYLQDLGDFKAVNEIYGSYLKEPFPARATVQVACLPLNVKVEIDAIACAK